MKSEDKLSKNHSIEFLRFFAATSVVFFHIPVIGLGSFGVDIFFAISGLVMMLSTQTSNSYFFLKRLIRILPTYYIFTISVYILAMLVPELLNNTSANAEHLLKSLLFIPFDKNGVGHYPILFLGWTLNYEMYFYLLFAIALKISHQYRDIIVTLMLCGIYLITQGSNFFPFSVYSSNIVFEFVLGIVAYHILFTKEHFKSFALLALIALCLFCNGDLSGRFYKLGIGSALFVIAVIRFSSNVKFPKFVIQLGGSSYALYLTHPYIIQTFDRVFNWFSMSIFYQVSATLISLVIVNIFAYIVWKLLEIPITRYLRNKLIK